VTHPAVVLWTGGKDSSLAFYEAKHLGYEVTGLATFVPQAQEFFAHPVSFMKSQSEAIGLPHHTLEIREPFRASYEKAIHSLKTELGIEAVVTGDIAEVEGHPNWIKECSVSSGVDVLTPLWGMNRVDLMNKLLLHRFQIIFSCVKKPWFTIDWLGRELDEACLGDLRTLSAQTGLDICGEQGEYHTLVLNGPFFQKRIRIEKFSKEMKDSLMYLNIQKVSLI